MVLIYFSETALHKFYLLLQLFLFLFSYNRKFIKSNRVALIIAPFNETNIQFVTLYILMNIIIYIY